jgi:hypothetical protein
MSASDASDAGAGALAPTDREARRVIGRILSIGFPLPGPRVDNYSLASAPSFFDYDAMVVDPSAAGELIESVLAGEAARTFTDTPVVATAHAPAEMSLAELLRRRQDETARLLANGGVIVCLAHPTRRHNVPGSDGTDDYAWLPSGEDADWRSRLVAGEGSQVSIVDYEHPLAAFVLGQQANIAYRAHFEARGAENVRVFARSSGGAAVAFEIALSAGRLIFVPALRGIPSGDGRYIMSDALQAGVRRALGVMAEGRAPSWVSKRDLPGLSQLASDVARAKARVEEAEAELRAAEEAHDEIARYQRLLWQEGALGLEEPVVDALKLIGFNVYASDPAGLQVRSGTAHAFVEIEASEHPVDLAPHYRLRQRIERAIERNPRMGPPRGILFVNGRRLDPPERRTQQASDALRTAAETMRYCIATTAGLYDAVATHLRGDSAAVEAYRQALLSTDGLLASWSDRA